MRKQPIVCAALLLTALASNCLLAQPAFLRKDVLVGENPDAVVIGDFDGDGRPDLAVNTAEGLFALLNAGGGNFRRSVRTEAAPRTFWLGTAADFNGDGRDDLVGSGFLYLSRGDGTFEPRRYLGAQEAVAAGDFNRDGKTDLVISNYLAGDGVRVLLGNGDGTFRSGAVVTATPMVWVQVADFNRDGRPDVATILIVPPRSFLLVFLGRDDGSFGPEVRTEINVGGGVLVADFNGDGLPDVFVNGRGTMLGKGDGNFQSPVPYASEVRGLPITAADFTGDGRADLVMGYEGNSIAICPGKGDGTLLAPVEQSVGVGFGYLNLGIPVDLDGDGRLDLVTANYFSNSISALMGRAQGGPALRRALSAAIDVALVAPESLATLFAPTPAFVAASASPPWPTGLGGTSLEVRDSAGVTRLAPLLFVSPTQINFQVPAGTALGEATLALTDYIGPLEAGSMQVDAVAPALFMASPGGQVPAATGVLVGPDGAQVPVPVYDCNPDWGCGLLTIPLSTAAGRPIYLSFFGTGFRGATPDTVTCTINGLQVPVLYAGPQGTPGLDQINIQLLPKALERISCDEFWGCDFASVTIRINGVPANSALLYIE